MSHEFKHPIIGQEAICPDGLGRVTAFEDNFPTQSITVSTYIGNRSCSWSPGNITLIHLNRDKQFSFIDNSHILYHVKLHRHLDELVAYFIRHTDNFPSKTFLLDFMIWSSKQCKNPTEDEVFDHASITS